jgi:sulfonate transport system permease protein
VATIIAEAAPITLRTESRRLTQHGTQSTRPTAVQAFARSNTGRTLLRTVTPVVIVLVWYFASVFGWIDNAIFASPTMVWDRFLQYASDGSLIEHVWISFLRVVLGLVIGVAIGTVLGLFAGLSNTADAVVDPPLQMLKAVPVLGLMPLMMIWLGIYEPLKVGLIVVAVIFPIYINLSKGIRSVDPRFGELSQTLGVGRRQLIREVILPGAWPHFLIGLRFALAVSWLVLVFGETIAANSGIGYLLNQGKQYMQTDVIVLCLVLYATLGLIFEGLVRLIERKTLSWRKEFVK